MKLSDYLAKKDLSYASFAKLIKVKGRMTVCRYANGMQYPRPEIARRIVAVTKGHVSLKDLYQ